jgi:hypothetical protein
MARTSRDPRTPDTKDLSASLQSNGGSCVVARVLNLCEGGMLVTASSDLKVAETTSFELSGPDFHHAGLAKVAHRGDGAMGLRFLSWQGPLDRPIRALVAARLGGQRLGSHHGAPEAIRALVASKPELDPRLAYIADWS